MSAPFLAALALALPAWLVAPEAAWAQARPVYRCSGNLYTDALDAAEARLRGCSPIDAVLSLPAAPSVVRVTGSGRPAEAASSAAQARVDPAQQRSRDEDKRRILEAELAAEQQRLAALQRELDAVLGPARPGEPLPAERASRGQTIKASIERSQADLAALRRELAKTAGGPG